MKKFKAKNWLSVLFAIPAMGIFPLTSCGLNQSWDFDRSTKGATVINYCLLIGQNDHADSIERTRYTRKALGTLDESEETKTRTKDNPNIAKPIQGHLIKRPPNGSTNEEDPPFIVNEIEQMEQKSLAGATWDPITANDTAGTWIAKHGHNITFFVSNNDSMAEGAMWASNWIKGMPIFGYDANATTIQRIQDGSITGTVDQNASTQCSSAMMITRNLLEDRDLFWSGKTGEECHKFGTTEYSPRWIGFSRDGETGTHPNYGYVDTSYISEASSIEYGTNRDILSKSTAISHLVGGSKEYDNVDQYLKPNGEAKQPSDMFDEFTHVNDATSKITKHYKVCHAYANRAEVYMVATLRPYFNEYARRLGLDLDIVEGDGTDEAIVINQIDARPTGANDYDAYLINMAKTTSTNSYITSIAKRACLKETACGHPKTFVAGGWDKFEDRLDTPIVFWNRQPHAEDGSIDTEIMNNKYFKYTYFVGVDAAGGGEVQGNMIVAHIQQWYQDWCEEHL